MRLQFIIKGQVPLTAKGTTVLEKKSEVERNGLRTGLVPGSRRGQEYPPLFRVDVGRILIFFVPIFFRDCWSTNFPNPVIFFLSISVAFRYHAVGTKLWLTNSGQRVFEKLEYWDLQNLIGNRILRLPNGGIVVPTTVLVVHTG